MEPEFCCAVATGETRLSDVCCETITQNQMLTYGAKLLIILPKSYSFLRVIFLLNILLKLSSVRM